MGVLKARVNGAWIPVGGGPGGGGADEVVVGATEPPLAETELWYDTSAPSSPFGLTANPNNALGIVAMGSMLATSPITLAGSWSQMTNPIAITTLVGRRYRIVFQVRAITVAVAGGDASANFGLYDAGAPLLAWADWYVSTSGAAGSAYSGSEWGTILEGDGAAHTYAIWGRAWGANASGWLNSNCRFYIEDMGPTGSPALPIPTTPPAWTPLTLTNGFTHRTTGYQPAVRKVGDVVECRGLMDCPTTTVSTVLTTLPSGFWPDKSVAFPVLTGAAPNTYVVRNTGTIETTLPNPSPQYAGLDVIKYSVTP